MFESIKSAGLDFLRNWSDFRGRATLGQYWWVYLMLYLFDTAYGTVAGLLACIPLLSVENGDVGLESFVLLFVLIGFRGLLWLLTFVPYLSLSVRRLHDIGRSGKWLWLFYGAPIGLTLICALILYLRYVPNDLDWLWGMFIAFGLLMAVLLSLTVWQILWFVKPSGPDNQWGPRA
ncbi:MAG: DUF805 domain-containing protein [Muribaculaceae bacterium]|nr:DUF805 domain-containing protein [Muribaculaceae bacterium]